VAGGSGRLTITPMRHYWPAPFFILACIALGLVPLVAFAWQQGGVVLPDAYVGRIVKFTIWQATLSTLLSVLPAVFIARALARQQFWGREALLTVLAIPLSLPVIVAVFGITAIYGASGILGGWFNLYGLNGILIAHVFFNLPLATRLLLQNLQNAPSENHRLAAQLNFPDHVVFRHVDWPVLRPALPRVAALIFLLCAGSFVIVLMFGGPQATTLEVAIYQSLRMDFDVSRALTLAAVQILLSGILVFVAAKALIQTNQLPSTALHIERFDGMNLLSRSLDYFGIAVLTVLVIPILLSVAAIGLPHISVSGTLLTATGTSLGLALLTCVIAVPLAWALAKLHAHHPQDKGLITVAGLASYIVPPAVLATGWFLAFRHWDGGLLLAVILIATMNALMALPFMLTVLAPAITQAAGQHDKLCAQLNVKGWDRLRLVDIPALRGPVAQTIFLALVLSMGDLTTVTLLGSQGLLTLPSLVQQQMGHYQSDAAGGTALVLSLICLGATFLAQRVSRWT
jgi:thiamine transport system permease protein